MVKMKESQWMLLFMSLLLVSFLYWFGLQSKVGEIILLTILGCGTSAYLCYYLKRLHPQRSQSFMLAIASGAVISLQALTAILYGRGGHTIDVLTAFAYLAVLLLLVMIFIATLKDLYPVIINHPVFSVAALTVGAILVVIFKIPHTIGSIILMAVQDQSISLQWYEPLSLIFLVQLLLAGFLLPWRVGMAWIAKQRETNMSLSVLTAMGINGLVGAMTVFALYFQ